MRRDGENSAPFLSSFFLLASSTLLLLLLLFHSDKRCYTHTHTHTRSNYTMRPLSSLFSLLLSLASLYLSIFSFLFSSFLKRRTNFVTELSVGSLLRFPPLLNDFILLLLLLVSFFSYVYLRAAAAADGYLRTRRTSAKLEHVFFFLFRLK